MYLLCFSRSHTGRSSYGQQLYTIGIIPISVLSSDIPCCSDPYFCVTTSFECIVIHCSIGMFLLVITASGAFFMFIHSFIHSFIPLACAECDDSLPFSGASSIPLCYVIFPATLLHQLFFHPLSPHLAIYFLVYLSTLLFPNSYIIPFWESYFLPFSVHAQTSIIYLTLLSLL